MNASNVSYPYLSRRAAPRRRPNPWPLRLFLLTLAGATLLVFLLMIIVAGYEFLHQDEIYPGVSTVLGVDLAGMSRQEAAAALETRFTYPDDAVFVLRYGGHSWEFTARELGVRLDAEATANAAYNAGREDGWLASLLAQLDLWTNGYPVAPVVVFDQSEAERLLQQIAADFINRPVIDATLVIQNGRAEATPSQIGRQMDVSATLSALRSEIVALRTRSEINVVVDETPPQVRDVSAAAERVNLMLSTPITFYMEGENAAGPWKISVEELEAMLVLDEVQRDDGTVDYEISLDPTQARAFLEELAPELTSDPVNARFVFDDDTRQLEVIQASANGRALDVEDTLARFQEAVFADDAAARRVRLAFYDVPPDVPDTATAQQLGITELVEKRTTYFSGSTAARRKNIQVAASRFHGLVIPPGGIFSFNEWLGDVSVETGYEQGLIIVGDQTITGVGGGVCQVSTTAFQTAFYAGFPILDRVNHAYRVSYYEQGEGPGMDATVYSPVVDFRFVNDTPYHLLIETYYNGARSTLTWKFYSTDVGRRVVKDGPYIRNQTPPPPPIFRANPQLAPGQIRHVDYATSGADVYVYRTVYEGDRVIIDHEEFYSHYVPWPDQYEVAPGDPRINR